MRCLALFSAAMLLLLSACGSGDSPTAKVPVAPASMFLERDYPFCGNDPKDKLMLGYYGSNLPDTMVYLYIVCHGMDTVYRDAWDAARFLTPADTNLSDSLAVVRIQDGMRALIDGKMAPPMDSGEVLPEHAFAYHLPGHTRVVAWSDSAKKAVLLEN